jgi:hypothetical protein
MILRSVRAQPSETHRSLPGDDLVPNAHSFTHAITIERSRSDVWPWLVQMGAGRAGWYSYDRIDNGGTPSLDRIAPELQEIAVGDVFSRAARCDRRLHRPGIPRRALPHSWLAVGGRAAAHNHVGVRIGRAEPRSFLFCWLAWSATPGACMRNTDSTPARGSQPASGLRRRTGFVGCSWQH